MRFADYLPRPDCGLISHRIGVRYASRARRPSASATLPIIHRHTQEIMPTLHVSVPHTLSRPEAKERLIRFIDLLRENHGDHVSDLDQSWEGDTLRFGFKTLGFRLGGRIAVTDQTLDAHGELPFSAIVFRHKIEAAIREQLTRLMAN